VKKTKESKRYAKMFLNAVGMDSAPEALRELAMVNALAEKSEEFRSLLVNPQFTEAERDGALRAVGKAMGLGETSVKFMAYISSAQAAASLGDILDKAVAFYSERKKRVKAMVITAAQVDRQYEGRLKESLKRLTDREVDIEYVTDPSLLGGMLVKVGSTMYDGSVKGQLRLLREELIKG
jgi:F-type H+-transporting ATPase subunit delta